MTSHYDVARRLASDDDGERKRPLTGTNMQYKPATDRKPERILGYDWATYAVRIDDTVIVDWAWYSYSMSTKKHIGIIENAARSSWSDCNLVWVHGLFKDAETRYSGSGIRDPLQDTGWDRSELPELGTATNKPLNSSDRNSNAQ